MNGMLLLYEHSICGSLVALRSPIFCSVSLRKTSHILKR